jgi:hypothetical protein
LTTRQQAEDIFVKMSQAMDMKHEEDIETAIALLIAFWMEHSEGMVSLWSILDQASNIYLSSTDVSNREIH